MPNNSSLRSNSLEETEAAAKKELLKWVELAENTNSIILMPVFIRPFVDPPIYTHSLSRTTLELTTGDLKRVDLQLLAMTSDTFEIIAKKYKKKN